MEITLIRHGKSVWQEKKRWINSAQFSQWIAAYDAAGICQDHLPPSETLKKARKASVFITSALPRAVQSAEHLSPLCAVEKNELFREAELPVPFSSIRFLRLPVSLWLVLARICWFCGYSPGVESYSQAVVRAERASQLLVEYAKLHETVVVVGHSWFHKLVGRQLIKKGWKCCTSKSTSYWHACTYIAE
ncbi:histidine phosphatase family protein [Anoxybacteroides rupiense]|uniref:histidine phosphatase family protein n=1 Tax=Anoxybacteroides rupiense TaxID=311460 RepID=UPI003FA523C3